MSFSKNGYTYEIICRPWLSGKKRFEYIRWKTGFRNLWERITREEYYSIKNQ